MNPVDEQAVLNDFVKYLDERGLSVCNYSRNGAGFWPVSCDGPDLVAAFMNVRYPSNV